MSFANINIGTTPGDHSGDPLRTAFNKINNNFQQIADGSVTVNINAPVQSVSGRTGNVILTATDVIGSVTMGDVQSAMTEFAGSYVTKSDLAANIDLISGDVVEDLNSLEKIATSLGNSTSVITNITSNLATKTTQINNLVANTVTQQETLNLLSDSISAANAAIAQNTSDIQILYANAASQTAYLDNLTANASSQGTYLLNLTSNAASQAAYLDELTSNAISQQSNLVALFSNAASQDASLSTLIANAAAQQVSLGSLIANVTYIEGQIDGANAAIVTANTAMRLYVDGQTAYVNQLWGANAESVQGQLVGANAAIVTANTAMKSYVDSRDSLITTAWTANAESVQGQLVGANAAIVTANTAMKSYVDGRETAITSAWTANAEAQQTQIAGLLGSAYTNSNVAAYLPSYSGNISGNTITLSGNIQTNGTFVTSRHQIKGYTTIGNFVDGPQSSVLVVNSTASQPIPTFATMQVVGPVTGAPIQFVLDAHSTSSAPTYIGRRSRGNIAVPSAVQAGDLIAAYTGKGYGATGFGSTLAPGFGVYASENYTDSAQGTYSVISYTVPGSTNTIHHTRFENNGNVLIVGGSTSVSPTTGALTVNGGVGIGGNLHLSGNIASLNSISSLNDITAGGLLYANSEIISNTAVYSPKYYFANGSPLSFSFDTEAATGFVENYGGNIYFANIYARQSSITGDGSQLPFTIDFTDVIATHNLTVDDILTANSATNSTSAYDGAFIVPNGGAGIQGNLFCAIQANTRIQAGQGGAYLPNVIGQFTSDVNGYSQVNMQNLHQGAFASSDFVVTADNGTDEENFGDFGIANSQYAYPGYEAILPDDTYLIANGGNLLLNAGTANKNIKFIVGGSDVTNIVGNWSESVLSVTTNIISGLDVTAQGNVVGTYFNGNVNGADATITNIDSYTGHFASNLATGYMAFGSDPLARNSGLIGQVVDSLGFVTQYNNGVILVNEQGSVEQNLFLGDTDITSNATLLGVSVTNGGGYNRVLDLTGTGNLFVSNVYATVYGDVSYTPANVSNWNSSVTTIAEALDELAQRLKDAGF